jgi:hypothetical protein
MPEESMFTPQRVVTKTLSNACAMKGGHRVSGIGYRAEKGVYALISLRIFAEWTHGLPAFPHDGNRDKRE